MVTKLENHYKAALKRALEIFNQHRLESERLDEKHPGFSSCLLAVQKVEGEYGLNETARIWLIKELLVEATVRQTLKRLYRGATADAGGLGVALREDIDRLSAEIPPGLREALFASLLEERCAPLVHHLCSQIQEKVNGLRADG